MTTALEVDDDLLRGWPLPAPEPDGDKEDRGSVLVVAGSREMPGAAILAGTAALRAGAGKLVIATPQSAVATVAGAVPEARVIALPEAADGGPTFAGVAAVQALAERAGCVLVGPGMIGRESTLAFVHMLLPLLHDPVVLLDALAMEVVPAATPFPQRVILTPHAGEMALLTGRDKDALQDDARACAQRNAGAWNAVVALKGSTTCIAAPDGRGWRHRAEIPGLGTCGSGDVLAGLIAGLAARGCAPEQAAVWGVALHARAAATLAERLGELGYLARELAGEVPRLMAWLARAGQEAATAPAAAAKPPPDRPRR